MGKRTLYLDVGEADGYRDLLLNLSSGYLTEISAALFDIIDAMCHREALMMTCVGLRRKKAEQLAELVTSGTQVFETRIDEVQRPWWGRYYGLWFQVGPEEKAVALSFWMQAWSWACPTWIIYPANEGHSIQDMDSHVRSKLPSSLPAGSSAALICWDPVDAELIYRPSSQAEEALTKTLEKHGIDYTFVYDDEPGAT